jgi:hypothetical protein
MSRLELAALDAKQQVLDESDYVYNFDRAVYLNRNARKVFSVEFIEDNSAETLVECIAQPKDGSEWRFYFNSPPSESVRRQLEIALG